ncbi:PilN domain-containing protein [Thauera aromatica]|nr:PilN domain-containing protein [Thauera aromatica]MCK2127782.1 PilN domain-containing protein [Thauera aromatica]
MALDAGNLNLFGFDLGRLVQVWRNGWSEAFRWPALAWLSPQEAVRVLLPGAGEVLRLGATSEPAPSGAKPAAVAVVLPDDGVLLREITLPPLAHDELRQALELEVLALSPFAAEDTVWGWDAEPIAGRMRVRLVLAARAHVEAALAAERLRLGAADPEVWTAVAAPIVLQGFAEGRRAQRKRAARLRLLSVLALTLLLVLALAATPVLQARERVFDAQQRYGELEREAAAALGARNALAVGNERVHALQEYLHGNQDPLVTLELITRLMPDDAYLKRLEIDGRKVRIIGEASNASQLMNALGAPDTGFTEVRAPSPISRARRSDKENFVIDFFTARNEAAK